MSEDVEVPRLEGGPVLDGAGADVQVLQGTQTQALHLPAAAAAVGRHRRLQVRAVRYRTPAEERQAQLGRVLVFVGEEDVVGVAVVLGQVEGVEDVVAVVRCCWLEVNRSRLPEHNTTVNLYSI